MPQARILFEGPQLLLGALTCRRDDETWGEEALVTHPIVALSLAPTWIRRGRRRHLVNPNHAVVHQAGDLYRREPFEGRGYRCLFMFADPGLLGEIAADLAGVEPGDAEGGYRVPADVTSLDASTFAVAARLAGEAERAADAQGAADPIRMTEGLHRILRGVVGAAYRARGGGRPARRDGTGRAHALVAEDAKAVLTSGYTHRLTVDEIARSVHVSPYHLTRVFRRQTGFAVHDYLNQLRVREALKRILEGQDDLAALAGELGFSSHSHLSANFRRTFGLAPSETRSGGPSAGALAPYRARS
jgi:AraC-like DNA-binding protein